MVLANPVFTAKLRAFSKNEDFQRVFQVTKPQKENQKDLEYAVRVVAHTYEEFERGRDVQEFLDQAIIKVMSEHAADEVLERVGWPISTLRRLLGDNALNPPKDESLNVANRFSLRALEGIVVGLARHKTDIQMKEDADSFVRERVRSFWSQPEILTMAAPDSAAPSDFKEALHSGRNGSLLMPSIDHFLTRSTIIDLTAFENYTRLSGDFCPTSIH